MPRKRRVLNPHCPLHVTARTNNRIQFPIDLDEVWKITSDYLYILKYGFNLEILAFVLMPNHFHLLVRDPQLQLSTAMLYFMRETSKEINRSAGTINRIWGTTFYSSVITDLPYYYNAYKYIYRNPIKSGLCSDVVSYKYSTLRGLLGWERCTIPLSEDSTLFDSPEQTIRWLNLPFSVDEERATQLSLRRSEMSFTAVRTSRRELFPSGLLTH